MGDGVLAKGDTGTCDEDLRLGERTALSFGMSPWRAPKERNVIRTLLDCDNYPNSGSYKRMHE